MAFMDGIVKHMNVRALFLIFGTLVTLIFLLILLLPDKKEIIQRQSRRERMADLSRLTQMYFKISAESNVNVDIKTLEQQVCSNGGKLFNPLADRKDKLCYNLIYPSEIMLKNGKKQVLVIAENDNVNSDDVAASTVAGFVFIMGKKEFKNRVKYISSLGEDRCCDSNSVDRGGSGSAIGVQRDSVMENTWETGVRKQE